MRVQLKRTLSPPKTRVVRDDVSVGERAVLAARKVENRNLIGETVRGRRDRRATVFTVNGEPLDSAGIAVQDMPLRTRFKV